MAKRFSVSSLSGTLQISYFLVTFIIGMTLVVVVWRGNSLYEEREELYALRSLKYHGSELRSALNRSFMLLQLYAQYDTVPHAEEVYYQTALDVFYDDAKVNFDSIQTISRGEIEAVLEIKVVMNELINKYDHLNSTTEKGDPLRNYLRIDMIGLVMSLNQQIERLILDEKNQEVAELEILNSRIERNNYLAIPLFLLVMVTTYVLGRRSLTKVVDGLKHIHSYLKSLARGEIPDNVKILPNEFGKSLQHIRTLADGLEEVKEFAQEVGNQNFGQEIDVFPETSELGAALYRMKKSLEQVAEAERERNWETQGVVEMSNVIRSHTENIQTLCEQFLQNLVEYSEAQQGAIFLADEEGKMLVLRAAYAYGRRKHLVKTIRSDEGIIGEVFQDRERVFMNDIPEDYTQITAGLGEASPTSLVVVPLVAQEKSIGVVEIATFTELREVQIRLIERTAEVLASSISSVASAEQMKRLLEESESVTQQMGAQEEELRQNTEELIATREELERQLAETQSQVEEKDHIFEDSNQGFVFVDASGRILRVNYAVTQILEFTKDEMIGDPISKFIPELKGLNRHAQRDSEQMTVHQYEARTRRKKTISIWASVTRLEIDKQLMFMIGLHAVTESEVTKSNSPRSLGNS